MNSDDSITPDRPDPRSLNTYGMRALSLSFGCRIQFDWSYRLTNERVKLAVMASPR